MESQFLSTPSARRATISLHIKSQQERISIHALREEGDTPTRIPASTHTYFYPRPPRGGRPPRWRPRFHEDGNFYPRPPRGGRQRQRGPCCRHRPISIHALREEGDIQLEFIEDTPSVISIHALREEGDFFSVVLHPAKSDFYPRPPRGGRPRHIGIALQLQEFLSTPSARRATPRGVPR